MRARRLGPRESLMLPFGKIDDSMGRSEVLGAEHRDQVREYCRAMGEKFGCPSYERYLFGLPVDGALTEGYLISRRGLRETVPHACGQETARFARELLGETGNTGAERPTVLELCTGVGQSAYSYAMAGFEVTTVEIHEVTREIATSNFARAGLTGRIECLLGDAHASLAQARERGERRSVVHLDPPWGGNYDYRTDKPFGLECLALDMPRVIESALDVSRVTVINMPHNVDTAEIRALADDVRCSAVVQYQFIADFPACFGQAPVYLLRPESRRGGPGTAYREITAHLTLTGDRIDG